MDILKVVLILSIPILVIILLYNLIRLNDDSEEVEEIKEEPEDIKVIKKGISQESICPKCGKGLKLPRYNADDELIFYGCSNFPKCKYKERIKKQEEIEEVVETPVEETITKQYVDILIDGFESTFTYLCPNDLEINKGDKLYIKDKFGAVEITILTDKYEDTEKDNKYYKKLEIVSKDYKPPVKKYINVKFISDDGYMSGRIYTYILPDEYNCKENDILNIISKHGESKVKVITNPYTDKEKDYNSLYKEIYIINKEEQ